MRSDWAPCHETTPTRLTPSQSRSPRCPRGRCTNTRQACCQQRCCSQSMARTTCECERGVKRASVTVRHFTQRRHNIHAPQARGRKRHYATGYPINAISSPASMLILHRVSYFHNIPVYNANNIIIRTSEAFQNGGAGRAAGASSAHTAIPTRTHPLQQKGTITISSNRSLPAASQGKWRTPRKDVCPVRGAQP